MKIVSWETLVDEGQYTQTAEFARAKDELTEAISEVTWPPGSSDFTIYPESGKAREAGNGVVPIKNGFARAIESKGWTLEHKAPRSAGPAVKGSRPGAFDAHLDFNTAMKPFAAEWETGNISSSHRAINRIGLGIKIGYLSGGVLILPSNDLARYLTDRIGNEPELRPYHDLWREWRLAPLSYFGIVAVEHDAISENVPKLAKGRDGRAII